MDDGPRKPNYRKMTIWALISAAGLALCAGIVIAAFGVFRMFQEGQEVFETVQKASLESRKESQKVDRATLEVRQKISPVGQEGLQEVQMVDIITSPRIIRLDDTGDSERLSVQGYYSDGSVGNLEDVPGAVVTYTSSDSSIAQVDLRGVVTGITAGGADIVVSYGNFNTTVPVLVWGPVRRIPAIDPNRLLEEDDGPTIVLNRVMVKLNPDYGPKDAGELAASVEGGVVFEFQTFPGYVIEFDAHTRRELDEALALLQTDSRVEVAYPDMVMLASNGPPNPIETLTNSISVGEAYLQAGMDRAWKIMNNPGRSLDPVIIAVIDDHFPNPRPGDIEHALISREFDDGRVHTVDLGGGAASTQHGAAVTSVIVARNNHPTISGESISGVVTSVSRLEYNVLFFEVAQENGKVFDHNAVTTALNVVNALDHLFAYEVDVINLSFRAKCHSVCGLQYVLNELMRGMSNVTFVVGAGNDDVDIRRDDIIPASFTENRGEHAARRALYNVITVAGTKENGKHPKSNYGSAITLGAPYEVWAVDTQKLGYSQFDGTSFSAPLVTGTVAMMKAVDSTLSPAEVKNVLLNTGFPKSGCEKNREIAWPDGSETKWKILDAGEAVNCVLALGSALSPRPIATKPPSDVTTITPAPMPNPAATSVPDNRRNPPPGSMLWLYEEAVNVPGRLLYHGQVDLHVRDGVAYMELSYPDQDVGRELVIMDAVGTDSGKQFWRFRPDGERRIVVNEIVYTESVDEGGGNAMDAITEEQLWVYPAPGKIQWIADDMVYIDSDGVLEVVNATGGDQLWRGQLDNSVRIHRIIDGVLYKASSQGLDAVDAATGKQLWRFQPSESVHLRTVVDGVAYIESEDNHGVTEVYAVDVVTGDQLWHYRFGSGIQWISDGVVYVAAGRILDALDAATGEQIWRYQPGGWIDIHAVVERVVYVESGQGLDAVDSATGNLLWRYQQPGMTIYDQTVADGVVYLGLSRRLDRGGSTPDALVAVDAATGRLLWSYRPFGSVRAVEDGVVFVESTDGYDGYLDAVNADTGQHIWRYSWLPQVVRSDSVCQMG